MPATPLPSAHPWGVSPVRLAAELPPFGSTRLAAPHVLHTASRQHPSAGGAWRAPFSVGFHAMGKWGGCWAAAGGCMGCLVAGVTCWCHPGIMGDPGNQERFLPVGCFSPPWSSGWINVCRGRKSHPLYFRECFLHGGAPQPSLPYFLLSPCDITVAAWNLLSSGSAAERSLSFSAQQRGLINPTSLEIFHLSYSVLSHFPHVPLKLFYCRNGSGRWCTTSPRQMVMPDYYWGQEKRRIWLLPSASHLFVTYPGFSKTVDTMNWTYIKHIC